VAADNVFWHGKVADPGSREPGTEAIRAFNRKLHADARVATAIAALGDGMMLACKR
jgi:caffeoyl-CoA O-methyltransferase